MLPEVAGREYIARSESWQNTGAEVTPVVTALQGGVTGSQLFYNARNGKAAGFVLANYGEISDNTAARGLLLSYADAAQTRPLTAVSLEYAKELHIGYPANNALVYTAQVFIMGTSDPTKPLTMDGKEVERTGEGGCFGVSVSLTYGKNYFTFRNGEDSLTLTIRRGSGTGDGTTSTLTSRVPDQRRRRLGRSGADLPVRGPQRQQGDRGHSRTDGDDAADGGDRQKRHCRYLQGDLPGAGPICLKGSCRTGAP